MFGLVLFDIKEIMDVSSLSKDVPNPLCPTPPTIFLDLGTLGWLYCGWNCLPSGVLAYY